MALFGALTHILSHLHKFQEKQQKIVKNGQKMPKNA